MRISVTHTINYYIDNYNLAKDTIERFNKLEPNNIIMIGDRDIDILAAKSANIKGVFFK